MNDYHAFSKKDGKVITLTNEIYTIRTNLK